MLYRMSLMAIPLLLGACATIIEGGDQNVSVTTYPPRAQCELIRGGDVVAFINPTPGTVSLKKGADDIVVHCTKDGYFDSMVTMESSLQDMTFGNIVFGGIVGVAVDAASGAMHEYDASVTVALVPDRFASIEARDEFFAQRERRVKTEAASAIAEGMEICQCDPAPDFSSTAFANHRKKSCQPIEHDCDDLVKIIEAQRDAKLYELSLQKDTAAVD